MSNIAGRRCATQLFLEGGGAGAIVRLGAGAAGTLLSPQRGGGPERHRDLQRLPQQCEYCGMGQTDSPKYLLSHEEFLEVTAHLYASGRRVLLLQSGENRSQTFVDHVCRCVRRPNPGLPTCSSFSAWAISAKNNTAR